MSDQFPADLVRNVAASTGLPEATAARVVADIAAYFAETVEDYVRRRHSEMRVLHRKNDDIWPQIAAELAGRRFGVGELSDRQLRRIVYAYVYVASALSCPAKCPQGRPIDRRRGFFPISRRFLAVVS